MLRYLRLAFYTCIGLTCMFVPSTYYSTEEDRVIMKRVTLPTVTFLSSMRSHIFENSCKFPVLQPLEPSFEPFLEQVGPPFCQPNSTIRIERDDDGNLYIPQPAFISLQCNARLLVGALRPKASTAHVMTEQFLLPTNKWFWVNYDNFVINCVGLDHNGIIEYERQFMGIGDISINGVVVLGKRLILPPSPYNLSTLSISILAFDSTSRTQFLRHMPQTASVMHRMGFLIMNGYNKVGDNSNVNLLPILAEPLEETKDMPLMLNGSINIAKILPYNKQIDPDKIRFIWKEMEEQGCETMFNDDIMHTSRGILHYPPVTFKQGFTVPPTAHYYRPYYAHLYKARNESHHYCWDNRTMPHEFADSWFRYTKTMRDRCAFSFSFVTSLTHGNPNNLQIMDAYLTEKLRQLQDTESLQNTVLILMGDHGQRIHKSQGSFVGRVEERTPLMSILLPSGFRNQFVREMANFAYNTNRLTSNFDIHETLLDLIERKIGTKRDQSRGTSLFLQIPANRTCTDANVAENFCVCMVDSRTELNETLNNYESDVKQSIVTYLKSCGSCLDTNTLFCPSMVPLTINKKLHHGMRDMKKWDKIKNKPGKYKMRFFEAKCSVSTATSQQLDITFRIRHDPEDSSFDVSTPPMITYSNSSVSHHVTLDEVCS